MLAKFLCAGLLAGNCMAAQAEQNWTFTFTGFFDQEANVFLPQERLTGRFSGTDLNGDGTLELGEVKGLHVDGVADFSNCVPEQYYSCSIASFSYHLGGKLYFDAGWAGWDPEGYLDTGRSVRTYDVDYYHRRVGPWPGNLTEHHLLWTSQTQQAVLGPVPEPGAYAMLGLGLLGLMLYKRRRAV